MADSIQTDIPGPLVALNFGSPTGIVGIPADNTATLGWGEPFKDGLGSLINPPLGTAGGTNPGVKINRKPSHSGPLVLKRDIPVSPWATNSSVDREFTLTSATNRRRHWTNVDKNITLSWYLSTIYKNNKSWVSVGGFIFLACIFTEADEKWLFVASASSQHSPILTFQKRKYVGGAFTVLSSIDLTAQGGNYPNYSGGGAVNYVTFANGSASADGANFCITVGVYGQLEKSASEPRSVTVDYYGPNNLAPDTFYNDTWTPGEGSKTNQPMALSGYIAGTTTNGLWTFHKNEVVWGQMASSGATSDGVNGTDSTSVTLTQVGAVVYDAGYFENELVLATLNIYYTGSASYSTTRVSGVATHVLNDESLTLNTLLNFCGIDIPVSVGSLLTHYEESSGSVVSNTNTRLMTQCRVLALDPQAKFALIQRHIDNSDGTLKFRVYGFFNGTEVDIYPETTGEGSLHTGAGDMPTFPNNLLPVPSPGSSSSWAFTRYWPAVEGLWLPSVPMGMPFKYNLGSFHVTVETEPMRTFNCIFADVANWYANYAYHDGAWIMSVPGLYYPPAFERIYMTATDLEIISPGDIRFDTFVNWSNLLIGLDTVATFCSIPGANPRIKNLTVV